MTQKTTSGIFFEQFCAQDGGRWEQIATKASDGVKTPDYAIFPKETKVTGIAVRQFTLGEKQPGEFDMWQEIGSRGKR